jgi:hypothetical protein
MLTVWLDRPRIAHFADLARRLDRRFEVAARVVEKVLARAALQEARRTEERKANGVPGRIDCPFLLC